MYVHTCLNVSQTLVCNLIEGCKVYIGLSAKQLHVVPVALNWKKKGAAFQVNVKPFFVK